MTRIAIARKCFTYITAVFGENKTIGKLSNESICDFNDSSSSLASIYDN